MRKVTALILILCVMTSLMSCSNTKDENIDESKATPTPVAKATYTYNDILAASPVNWNPHAWETDADDYMRTFCAPGFVDTTIADDGESFEWVYEMATAITDITADYPDKEKYGIDAEVKEQRVYRIDLNPAACWEDGTKINADSYIYSMKQCLNPDMKNYRSNSYTDSEAALLNAKKYFQNGKEAFISLNDTGYESADAAVKDDKKLYIDISNFWGITDKNGNTSLPVTDNTMIRDEAVTDENATEAYVSAKYLYDTYLSEGGQYAGMAGDYLGIMQATKKLSWEEVGLIKSGEYQLIYICELPVSMFNFMIAGITTWLVKEDIYESGKKEVGGLLQTDYGTSVATFSSYGPYKLVSFEKDKQFVLVKNEKWYGYTDGKHENEYQTTQIKCAIIGDHNTALQLFNQGALDNVELTSDDLTTYRMSDYLVKTDQTNTFRYIFATDINALKALEAEANDGSNKRVLSYRNFRKAISLSMDRNTFTAQATPGYKPAYYLYNYLYYYDIEHNTDSQYRKTDAAMKAILDIYDISYGEGGDYATIEEAFNSITGYDVEQAKTLFQSVYEQAKEDGNYTDGQMINIVCMCSAASSLTADDTRQQDLLNQFVADATKGTGFEGKIRFTFKAGSDSRYEDVAAGKVEMIRGAWSGAAFYPFSLIRCYTEPDYMGGLDKIHESCGWNPTVETLDVTYDFDKDGTDETVTKTFQNWTKTINGDGEYANEPETALHILASLEAGVIGAYQTIPWAAHTICMLRSRKIEFATYEYNIMYDYGGIRLYTYNYNDDEWAAYIAEKGGTLNYE